MNNIFKNIIISCPWGNYFNRDYCTSTIGTYTLNYRGGFWKRLWKVLTTVRYDRRTQSWINKLGLPNPGIYSLNPFLYKNPLSINYDKSIISVYGFNKDEWRKLSYYINAYKPLACELNLSCPNVNHTQIIDDIIPIINYLLLQNVPIIAKLPPINWTSLAEPLYTLGVRIFHCCNTIPSSNGGISGKPLKPYSIACIKSLRQKYGNNITIIGGGGITESQDIFDYIDAGANYIAIGSMLFNPFNWKKLKIFNDIMENNR